MFIASHAGYAAVDHEQKIVLYMHIDIDLSPVYRQKPKFFQTSNKVSDSSCIPGCKRIEFRRQNSLSAISGEFSNLIQPSKVK